ncbi:MAG: hypothetical protein E6K61_13320 [Nitrospirae bacterium]|nr:MAG: hypothetical protein E6K61_13320 [Nitrospirota bacterium]
MKAVVLASGGLDSTVTAAVAKRDGCRVYLLTISYGQRHRVEVERARQIAMALGAAGHLVLEVDLRPIGGSALTADGKGIEIRAPLLHLTKAEIIRLGASLGVPFHLTHSCYDPAADGRACGRCDSCRIRREGFQAAGLPDPIAYAEV